MSQKGVRSLATAVSWLYLASAAWAQSATTGTIAGLVRDTSGAVLPGATVEASSPALIEKVRTAITDESGNYKIVDLRPGTYSVTVTLTGFSTFKREALELNTGVTATVNADLRIGAIEETVTVTGATPVVDVQNVRTQNVFTRQVLDSVPTNRTIQGFTSMIVGAINPSATAQDVGGNQSEASASTFGIHGSRATDLKLQQDGMNYNNFTSSNGGGSGRFIYTNQAAVQEVTLQTGGMSAESETGGVQLNVVPKEGGNTFKVYFSTNGSGPGLQHDNLDAELRARGIASSPRSSIYDVGGGLGGPIVKDRLWFYTAHRWWGNKAEVAGNYWNANQGVYIGAPGSGVARYVPDLARPAALQKYARDNSVRLTWQVAERHKVNFSHAIQDNCSCFTGVDANQSPEASYKGRFTPNSLSQATWSYPATNRLLFEAGTTIVNNSMVVDPRDTGVSPDDISIQELSTGYRYNSRIATLNITSYNYDGRAHTSDQLNGRASASYITGSHAFKTGLQFQVGEQFTYAEHLQSIDYTFRDGVPQSLRLWASPLAARSQVRPNLALFAQDQWTVKKLTLNMGARFDYLHSQVPAQSSAAGRFVPERAFGVVNNVPNWKDVSPRLGVAYDLFGNGKTAIKGSIGRYVLSEAVTLADANNPANSMVTNATRTWTDQNGNFTPDCDLLDPVANAECGRLSDVAFGTVRIARRYDSAILEGWSVRPYNWQASASIQHELAPAVAINVGYFRAWYGNFTTTDNRLVAPSNYSPFCVTAPTDTRLGSASGRQLCGLYDLNPAQFGLSDNLVTQAATFGKRTEVYNGVDITMSARFGDGGLIQGGMNTGQTVFDNCVEVDYPGQTLTPTPTGTVLLPQDFCKTSVPFEGQTQFKFAGVYPLPWWGVQASATLQNLPGIPIAANRPYTSTEIAPSLGRNLSSGATGTATIGLLEPNTVFENRLTQVDIRFTKIVRLGRARMQGMFDIYNALNANTVLAINPTYGATWLRPTAILAGRLFKFGAQFDF